MPLEIPSDTPPALIGLVWLVGTWEGAGVVGYPGMTESRFGQEVEFWHDGRPFLHYRSQSWLLDEDGNRSGPAAVETGFWRAVPREGETGLEIVLAHDTGIVEIYVGAATGPRIEVATDVVARTETSRPYAAAQRMYGLVEGDLMWVMDMSAGDTPMTSHASARLKRV